MDDSQPNRAERRRVLYSPNSTAEALDLSRSKVYALMKAGSLRYVNIGGDRRIPAEELERIAREGVPAKPAS
ncbi:MAG: helix-turn-helix domain-containing protein [Burkholderiales bacterium]